MKGFVTHFYFLLISLIGLVHLPSKAQEATVYIFDIKEEIGPPVWRTTKLALQEAQEMEVDKILIRMNTYGGLVDAADSIRTALLKSPIPTAVWIENNAASAGALISIACDSIYMLSGSTIGAATVVNQTGEQVPDKYQSYMRKKMRATAEQQGRDPDMAEAMVDPDKTVPGISDSGKVLTLTVKEALTHGFCEAEINELEAIFKRWGLEQPKTITYRPSVVDKMIHWLINPAVSGILIMVIIGGIYFELQTPGVGFPIAAAVAAAVLYFAPLYLEGLAENWEILLFIAGIILLAVELFVIPGFGVAGTIGLAAMIGGLSLSLVKNVTFSSPDGLDVDGSGLLEAIVLVVVSASFSLIASIWLGGKALTSSAFSFAVLSSTQEKSEGFTVANDAQSSLIGKTGHAFTILRPSGKIKVDDKIWEATAQEGFIEQGTPIKVTGQRGAHLVVIKQ